MITPRRTRLVRVADLHAFRRVTHALAPSVEAIVVPTRAASELLRRSLASEGLHAPSLLTRAALYDVLQERLAPAVRRVSGFERDALAQAAAERAATYEPELSFKLRPGLISEMLRFYDQLRRQSQLIGRFEELITQPLTGGSDDRGAGRLLIQTRFLAAAFREYERLLAAAGACDEHTLRDRLLAQPASRPIRRLLVTVADWIADPDGLFAADFDLLARIPRLEAVDLIATTGVLASGFHERIHSWWPGLEEVEASDLMPPKSLERPVLLTPPVADNASWFTFRDREEELVDVARRFRAHEGDRTAVVFKHPLPYLYLAPDTLGAGGVPFEVFDALPLAAEPVAAAIDAVLDAVETGFTRRSLVALLRSPHFHFEHGAARITREDVSALDRALSGARYLGDISRLEGIAAQHPQSLPALHASLSCARELEPLLQPAAASSHLARVIAFIEAHHAPVAPDDAFAARAERGWAEIRRLLGELADAHARLHDPEWTIADVASAVRRAISEQTFDPASSIVTGAGVFLIDEQAARYGDFDEVVIVGLIENEWPERPRRNIFYGAGLLKALGWPSEKDRRGGADARFVDLVGAARARTILSTITLDDETLVTRSTQLDEIPRARLTTMPLDFVHPADESSPVGGAWFDLRSARTAGSAEAYHGRIGPQPPRPWSVSSLETYIGCPFKFFAQHVLRLQEEPDDEEVMDPRRQGQFVHEVFEQFFDTWQRSGRRTITAGNLDDARSMFEAVVERLIERLPEGEAGLERTRLLGSPAAAGLGEAVFRMEAERPTAVVERLLEQKLDGALRIRVESGERTVHVRGKADRIDLLEDGTFRLIDYKLGWPPNKARALQLPIYARSIEQRLAYGGKTWTLGEAAYLAFKGPRRVVPLFASLAERDQALASAEQRLAETIDAIERGEFPPTPDDVFRCESCSFTSVCRKDYV